MPVVLPRSVDRDIGDRTHGDLLVRDWHDRPISAHSARVVVTCSAHRVGLDNMQAVRAAI
ncbi:hypothetical protein [Aeromicrobium sp. CF3.5]|uniref:hypothetical protein n=1 Tax=Aeromicrobium sp. CF3.5 TaxID=3373078 RepID=UPI003EE7C32D